MRRFKDFTYRTLKGCSRRRQVIGKAEHLPKGPNPRFVLTSLSKKTIDARQLHEQTYCARGDMENRIKEQQLYLFADRTSSHSMRANQLRRRALHHTELESAQCDTTPPAVKNRRAGARQCSSHLLAPGQQLSLSGHVSPGIHEPQPSWT